MVFIIPDDLLDKLRCSSCDRYLSVTPVKVYPNKKIKCGRCCEANDAGLTSLYGIVTENALFKCTNRYEGCSRLLTYSEVISHENSCKYGTYRCPICHHFKGSAYYFFIHYKQNHEENLLKNRDFTIKIQPNDAIDEYYMYYQDDFLFIISVTYYDMTEAKLSIAATSIGLRNIEITQKFTLSCPEANFLHVTNKMQCTNFNESGDSNSFEIDLTNKPLQFVSCKFEYEAMSFCSFPLKRTGITRACQSVLTYPIYNFSKKSGVLVSPKYDVCDLSWQIVLDFRVKEQFRFFLFCCEGDIEDAWSCYMSIKSKVLSVRPEVFEPKEQNSVHTFTKDNRAAKNGICILPLAEIIDPTLGYIKNDVVTVELELDAMRDDTINENKRPRLL